MGTGARGLRQCHAGQRPDIDRVVPAKSAAAARASIDGCDDIIVLAAAHVDDVVARTLVHNYFRPWSILPRPADVDRAVSGVASFDRHVLRPRVYMRNVYARSVTVVAEAVVIVGSRNV